MRGPRRADGRPLGRRNRASLWARRNPPGTHCCGDSGSWGSAGQAHAAATAVPTAVSTGCGERWRCTRRWWGRTMGVATVVVAATAHTPVSPSSTSDTAVAAAPPQPSPMAPSWQRGRAAGEALHAAPHTSAAPLSPRTHVPAFPPLPSFPRRGGCTPHRLRHWKVDKPSGRTAVDAAAAAATAAAAPVLFPSLAPPPLPTSTRSSAATSAGQRPSTFVAAGRRR